MSTGRFFCRYCRRVVQDGEAIRVRLPEFSLSVAGCPTCRMPLRLLKCGGSRDQDEERQ